MSSVETLARPSARARDGEDGSRVTTSRGRSATAWTACGLFFFVFGIYALSSPGRIDIIDGQARYDVALNWALNGRPLLTDPWIKGFEGVSGRGGFLYSFYGAGASALALPLVWMGLRTNTSEFLFSLTSPLLGAAIAPLMFLFYLELGVDRRRALVWTLVGSFATYLWAISNSSFDNAQHAFFAFAAAYFAFVAARRKSVAHAVQGGIMAGMLLLYQEYLLLIIPALALMTVNFTDAVSVEASGAKTRWGSLKAAQAAIRFLRAAWNSPGEERSSCIRCAAFAAGIGVGVALWLAYNHARFGAWLDNGKLRFTAQRGGVFFGNPFSGMLTLLISPGKSVFLYSPTLLLAFFGFRRLQRREPALFAGIVAATILLVLFLSCILFAGGDWCWGPRYLTPLLPLWALTFPFAAEGATSWKRKGIVALVALSFLIQGLALSVETQRFFFERNLHDFFWAEDSWVYFEHSALWARFGEALTLPAGVPATATHFNSVPDPDRTTYSLLGPPPGVPREHASVWMRNFQIFYLPRPWPFWVAYLNPELRPINLPVWLAGLFSLCILGICLMMRGSRRTEFA